MKKSILIFVILVFPAYANQAQTVTDIDGNVYQTIGINNQLWMQENLKTTHYADGTPIPQVNTLLGWSGLDVTDKAYCYYDDDSTTNAGTYGALYNWAAAMNGADSSNTIPSNVQGVCPDGWHLPSDAEWHALVLFLDPAAQLNLSESPIAGGKMKEAGTDHWVANTGGTNESGFTGLPAGRRLKTGVFTQLTYNAMWWSTTEIDGSIIDRTLYYSFTWVDRGPADKTVGYAVRCLCNTPWNQIPEIKNTNDVQIYPNPAADKINVGLANGQHATLSIYNAIGALVMQKELTQNHQEIGITCLQKGIYFVKISGVDFLITKKLIVE